MNRRKLQSLINRTAKASAAFFEAQTLLNDYCLEVYGTQPSDVDCDEIIDAVLGGCGVASGMSVDEFDTAMKNSMGVT